MSERSTKTLETPIAKIAVVTHDYMTGGETMDLEGVGIGAGIKKIDGHSGDMQFAAEDVYKKRLKKLAETMIVSIGTETEKEKVWTSLRDMHSTDYTFVMKAVELAAAGLTRSEGKE